MMLSSKLKVLAVAAVVASAAFAVSGSVALADQSAAWGQIKKTNPDGSNPGNGDVNGNGSGGGQDHAFRGNTDSRGYAKRCAGGHGNGCAELPPPTCADTGTCPPPIVPPEDEVGMNEEIDCTLVEFKNDARCAVPVKKSAKRKLVAVKMTSEEPAAAPAPAPVVEAAIVPAAPAPAPVAEVIAAPVVVTKASASGSDTTNLSTLYFQ